MTPSAPTIDCSASWKTAPERLNPRKPELVRSVGQQLIALAATQSVSDGSVEWSVRTANEGQSLEIELALRGQSLNVRLRDVRFGDVIRPVFTDNAQGDDVAF